MSYLPTDTAADAAQFQISLLRSKSPSERFDLARRLSRDMIGAAKRAIARKFAGSSSTEINRRFIELHYGEVIPRADVEDGFNVGMSDTSDLVQALRPVVQELDRLKVRHYVGGSLASSIHGAARSTLDVDLAAELDEPSALDLIKALQTDFYVSANAAVDAVRRRSCFNLIHLKTSFKVDIFVSKGRAFDLSVQTRAVNETVGGGNPLSVRFATAEDTILLKLEWYRLGNEISERQWSDVTAVATLQADGLDRAYLQRWASELGVADLLERLLAQVAQ